MEKRRAASALEGKQLPPHFWENLQKLPRGVQPNIQQLEGRLLDQTASVKTDKQTQSPLLKIFKDIMQREKKERDQEKEISFRREVEKRRITKERVAHGPQGKPPKCTEVSKGFQLKPNSSDFSREKEARQNRLSNHTVETQEERRSIQKPISDKKSSHTDRHRTPEYNRSYVTSAEKTSASRSGSIWKPGCQPTMMHEERRPSQVKTDPVSVAPMSLKKKMFWKKKDKFEPETKYAGHYSDVVNMEYDDRAEDLRRRSHHSVKLKIKSNNKHQGKKTRKSDHDVAVMDDDCCEILCETDDAEDQEFSNPQGGSEAKENITLCPLSLKKKRILWKKKPKAKIENNERSNNTSDTTVNYSWMSNASTKCDSDRSSRERPAARAAAACGRPSLDDWHDGSHCWANFVTELKKCKGMERAGVTLSLILLTVLIVGGVMYYYKAFCAPKTVFPNQQYDFDSSGEMSPRVKKSDDYASVHRNDWNDGNIKTVDGVAGLSDYLGIRDLRQLQSIANGDDAPNSLKLREFIRRLIDTDNQIKQIRKGIMSANLLKQDHYLKSERFKRSIRWRHGPRLFYKKQKKEERTEENTENEVEEEAREAQEKAEETQEKATEVAEHATTAADLTVIQAVSSQKKPSTKHTIPTTLKNRSKKKTTAKNSDNKQRIRKNINYDKRDINLNEPTTKAIGNSPAIAIIVPKKKLYDLFDDSKHMFTKCTHVSKDHKSHEEHLKHPYYKNTEHLDRFLDMLLETNNASRLFDNDMFKSKKTKCKHPTIVVGPVKLIPDKSKVEQNMAYAREEVAKLKEMFTTTQLTKLMHKTNAETLTTVTTEMSVMTKTVTPKYNIFMSILTINPDQRVTATEDLRSLSDRKLHSRRLMQVEEDAEDIGVTYEDLKEVLSDDKIGHDMTEHRVDERKKRDDEKVLMEDKILKNDDLLQLHVIKPAPAKMKLYNPNWKGPLPLYPDELNLLMKQQYTHNKEKIPVRNNEVPEEIGEDESVFNDVDYIEDYAISNNGKSAKRAQAYSDYGVLTKDDDVIASGKNTPREQDDVTTEISEKLRFGKDSNRPIRDKRSKNILNEPRAEINGKKYFGRIGRSLKSNENLINDDYDVPVKDDFYNQTSKVHDARSIHNGSIKIKNLTKHRHYKKFKCPKSYLRKHKVDMHVTKTTTDSVFLSYDTNIDSVDVDDTHFLEDFKFSTNRSQTTGTAKMLSTITDVTDTMDSVLNYSFLDDIFQEVKVKVTTFEDLNDITENWLNSTDDYPKTTAASNNLIDSTYAPDTSEVPDEFLLDDSSYAYVSDELPEIPTTVKANTKSTTEIPTFFDDFNYDEQTTLSYFHNETISEGIATEYYYVDGEKDIVKKDTEHINKERDLFSYLAKWLCAIVGAVSNVSTTTVHLRYEDENSVDNLEPKFRTRTLKSVVSQYDNITAENVTASSFHTNSPTTVANTTTSYTNVNVTDKVKDVTNANQQTQVANKTIVKRNADDGSNFVYFSDDDEEYGVDINPIEKTSEKRRKFIKKQKDWIQKKVKKLGEKLRSNPYKKLLMVKQESKLKKDADSLMNFNDTRFRRNSARPVRAPAPMDGPMIDFNVLNSKMKEICSQAVNEVQQMRNFKAREDEVSNPTSSLMQQLAKLMTDLVDLQVKQKTCRKLPPDLQEFLVWLTSPTEKQRPLAKSVLRSGGETDGDLDADALETTDEYGIAGLHELEATLGYHTTLVPNIEDIKPQCVDAMHSVENLLYEYSELGADNKKKISGVKDYLNNQLNFLRNQVDMNDLTSVYNVMRYRREAPHHPNREKRKFVKNFNKKHTKTTANNYDDAQSGTERLRPAVTQRATVAGERDRRNLRDVYYRALSESSKFSTSTTTEKHR